MNIHLTHRPRLAALAVTALFGLTAVACGGNTTEPTSSADTAGAGSVSTDPTVEVANNRFGPAELTVEVGTTVTWNWADGAAQHDVVGDGFESDIQSQGTFEHRFDTPGTFIYVCTLHSGMDGTVIVVPA